MSANPPSQQYGSETQKRYRRTPAYKASASRKEAKRKGLEYNLPLGLVADLTTGNCFYCGLPATGIDRVDNSVGYVEDNVVAACWGCNKMKNTQTFEQFIAAVKRIAVLHG